MHISLSSVVIPKYFIYFTRSNFYHRISEEVLVCLLHLQFALNHLQRNIASLCLQIAVLTACIILYRDVKNKMGPKTVSCGQIGQNTPQT